MNYVGVALCGLVLVMTGCSRLSSTQSDTTLAVINQNMTDTQSTRPSKSIIGDTIGLTQVTLYVHDLDVMKQWYGEVLGMNMISSSDDTAVFGSQATPFLQLIQREDYEKWNPQSAGLYHIAYLHATQQGLAQRILRVAQQDSNSFGGSSDHSVSEAFYFTDPEGNGVELYYDRDPATRQRRDGQVVMGSAYLDPNDYIARYAGTGGLWIDDSTIGHIHLQVGDLALARQFYVGILGFDVTSDSSNGALFVSAGGYHHHFGLNVRNSNEAGKRPDRQYGLGEMTITLPQQADVDNLKNRLTQAGVVFTDDSNRLQFVDPWNNKFVIVLR